MSKLQQYLSDLKTHQEEQIEIPIENINKQVESEESEDEQNEILNEILKCQQRGLSEKVFDFDLGNSIKLSDVDDMNKSALYLDALAWLYSNRVDRTYVESLKLKVNLLRVYDTSTIPNAPPTKKQKQVQQQQQQEIKKSLHNLKNIELKEITKYGESTLDFKPYQHQYDTLQINPFFNQTSKSLDMQDLSTLIIYNPKFDENLAIIIDPDQLLKINEQSKQILTGFIKLEIDTSVLDYSNLVSKQFKIDFDRINAFRERYKFLLNKKDIQTVKLEKHQQNELDKFVNEYRVFDDKLKQAQQTINQQRESLSQIGAEDLQFQNLNQQYQESLKLNADPDVIDLEEQIRKKVEQMQVDTYQQNDEQSNLSNQIPQVQSKLVKPQIQEQIQPQQKTVQDTIIQPLINQMEVEEFNNYMPDFELPQMDYDEIQNQNAENQKNVEQQFEQQRQILLNEQKQLYEEKKKILQQQFSKQQQEALEKQQKEALEKQQKEILEKQQQVQQEEFNKLSYQQQFQDIFNDMNVQQEEWELDPEEEFDQDLAPYEEQQLQQQQLQKQANQQQQSQQQQQNQQPTKKKIKKQYPDTFNFDDANELTRLPVLNTVGNTQRDFEKRELVLKCLSDNCQDFDYFRYFEYFTREYAFVQDEEEQQIATTTAAEPESYGIDEIQYQDLQECEINNMIENYQQELDHYILPFRVQANNNNEPITIKQLQVILERVIESILGNVEFLKLEKTLPLIMNERISKSKLFAALLFVSKNKGYLLKQKNDTFTDIIIVKQETVDQELEMNIER